MTEAQSKDLLALLILEIFARLRIGWISVLILTSCQFVWSTIRHGRFLMNLPSRQVWVETFILCKLFNRALVRKFTKYSLHPCAITIKQTRRRRSLRSAINATSNPRQREEGKPREPDRDRDSDSRPYVSLMFWGVKIDNVNCERRKAGHSSRGRRRMARESQVESWLQFESDFTLSK